MSIKEEIQHIFNSTNMEPPKAPARKKRSLGDVYSALEAQRIYSPGMPAVPKPITASPAAEAERGTAAAMDTTGAWLGKGK